MTGAIAWLINQKVGALMDQATAWQCKVMAETWDAFIYCQLPRDHAGPHQYWREDA